MKAKAIIIAIILSSFNVIYAELNKPLVYIGSANFFNISKEEAVSYASYTFYPGNKYEFFISCGRESRATREINKKYIKNDEYYEYGDYKIILKDGFYEVYFSSNGELTYKKKLGMIKFRKSLILYEGDIPFFISEENEMEESGNAGIEEVSVSSYLRERTENYNGDNFIGIKSNMIRPWIEGKSGSGIGEYIILTIRNNGKKLIGFAILNGYVSFVRKDLFRKNGRVKTIKISGEHGGNLDAELEDFPAMQVVLLNKPSNLKLEKWKIEIVNIFKGSKYDDTCITMIIPIFD